MATGSQLQPDHVLAEARQSWTEAPPATVEVTREQAWLLLAAAQALHLDPELDRRTRTTLEHAGRVLQDTVCAPTNSDLHSLAEAGWSTMASLPLPAEHPQPPTRYAFLIENSDDGVTWFSEHHDFDGRPAGGGIEEIPDARAERLARRVLARRFSQLRADTTIDWDESWYRVTVWDIDRTADRDWRPATQEPSNPSTYGCYLQAKGFIPHAVEVRTPSQVRDGVDRSRAQPDW